MIDFLIYLSFSELGIGAVMFVVANLPPNWLKRQSGLFIEIYRATTLFLVFSAGHNLIGLGIYGLFI